MRIVSYNLNGIRSAMTKGFTTWLESHPGDVIGLQELKAHKEAIDEDAIRAAGYEPFWFPAQKKGYSGVGLLCRQKPDLVVYGSQIEQSDFEGRIIRADFGAISIINCYFPSGTSGDERQAYKYQWLDELNVYLKKLKKDRKQIILCGDYNIAHTKMDIHDPVGNKNSSGFLPEERAWMDKFLETDMVDTFRHIHPDAKDQYSWWSFRAASRERNKGWRIDYITCTDNLRDKITGAGIWQEVKHSDHCPIYADFNI